MTLTRIACMHWFVYSNMVTGYRLTSHFHDSFTTDPNSCLKIMPQIYIWFFFFKFTVLDGLLITNPTMC